MQTQFSLRPRHTLEPSTVISLGTAQSILTILALSTAVLALIVLATS